jgi:hypothetical protein
VITQPHIGRQVSHFVRVDIGGIQAHFSEDRKYRYSLSVPFFGEAYRTKTVAVILKNPSSADALKADKTVSNVEKTMYKTFSDVSYVEILNLFALRGTYPKDIMQAYDSGVNIIGNENDTVFREVLEKSDYIVLAWGGASPIRKSVYDERIDIVYAMINELNTAYKLFRKAEKGSNNYPFHACYWPDNTDFIEL